MAKATTTTTTTAKANPAPAPAPAPALPGTGKANLAPSVTAKANANPAPLARAPWVAYLAPARPNLPTASAPVQCPGMVPQGASIAWHGSNGNANLYPRFNAMPAGAMVQAGPVQCSARRLHGHLAPVLARAFANGPVLWGTIANLPVQGHGTLAAHLTYLTGHGIICLAPQ